MNMVICNVLALVLVCVVLCPNASGMRLFPSSLHSVLSDVKASDTDAGSSSKTLHGGVSLNGLLSRTGTSGGHREGSQQGGLTSEKKMLPRTKRSFFNINPSVCAADLPQCEAGEQWATFACNTQIGGFCMCQCFVPGSDSQWREWIPNQRSNRLPKWG